MGSEPQLRILFVEDVSEDAELARRALRNEGLEFLDSRVDTAGALRDALRTFRPDLIISDYRMPQFDGMRALRISLDYDPALPFIVLTGSINEDTATTCMRAGATDYVLKERMNRLPFAVREALEKKEARVAARAAEQKLRESEEKYRVLVESSTEAIVVAQDFAIRFANAQCEVLTGRTREELVGKPFEEFIHPEDRALVLERYALRLRGEEAPPVYAFRVAHPSGQPRWVDLRVVRIQWEGKPATLNLLSDVTERKQAAEALEGHVARLERTLQASAHALASAIELRDPYTAGHQRRVADLACTLAQRLEWSESDIAGLRLAAGVHDIGKILVPAEILAKPGRLTSVERQLVEAHPQAGHDLLKDIEFPWPVAETVLQHHERLDGSGYPHSLAGEGAILPAARILAIADVIEAMASHRPYRAALGVDVALEEIKAHRGTLYDARVVDACVELFASGYTIPGAA
jgi:PAS domain S-box-containing protein